MDINTLKILNFILQKGVKPSEISKIYKIYKHHRKGIKKDSFITYLTEIFSNKKNCKTVNLKKDIIESWERKEFDIINITQKAYPYLLKEIFFCPPLLFYKGKSEILNSNLCIAIVGTRRCSRYGLDVAKFMSGELTKLGFTIVSGMALGIDRAAHEAALINKGDTIGVLGTGINKIYPLENGDLFKEMAKKGCLITEFLPGMGPLKRNFPARNRIISGLSLGVIVIEAGEKSGAIITARTALNENREVFAIPGNIFSNYSYGCHKLIQDGAKLVQNVDDILLELESQIKDYGIIFKTSEIKNAGFSKEKHKTEVEKSVEKLAKNSDDKKEILSVFSCLGHAEKSIEEVQKKTKIDKNKLLQILSLLQLNECIIEKSTNNYVLYK